MLRPLLGLGLGLGLSLLLNLGLWPLLNLRLRQGLSLRLWPLLKGWLRRWLNLWRSGGRTRHLPLLHCPMVGRTDRWHRHHPLASMLKRPPGWAHAINHATMLLPVTSVHGLNPAVGEKASVDDHPRDP